MSRRRQQESPLLPILALLGVGIGAIYVFKKEKSTIQRLTRGLPSLPKELPPWWSLPAFLSPFAPAAVAIQRGMKMGYSAVMQSAQQKLNDLGYGPVPLTGEQDAATHQAVLAFQRAKGLVADGVIGPQTLGALGITLPQGQQLPPTRTPISPQDLVNTLAAIWPSVVGGTPSEDALLVLAAQWALETGAGQSMVQYNIGNIKAPNKTDGDYTYFDTKETINGKTVTLKAPGPGTRFRAFSSLADGAQFYLQGMKNRWTRAWPYALAGNPEGFAQGLYDQHYYTGFGSNPVAGYAAGLRKYFDLYKRTLNINVA
jgi:peptidoglycan hydrolase-like protein with peptidoglycan-binding domain